MKQIQFKNCCLTWWPLESFYCYLIFYKPALDPELVMKQGDVTGWQGMSHQSFVYKEKHGHLPLWITSMFSGMPAYQVAIEGDWSPLSVWTKPFNSGFPTYEFFFLACIGFLFPVHLPSDKAVRVDHRRFGLWPTAASLPLL